MLRPSRIVRSALISIIVSGSLLAPMGVAAATKPAPASSLTTGAPLDEYFGRMKMSIIGIKNELRTVAQHVMSDPSNAARSIPMLALIEDSVHDWEHKYPHDSWIPQDLVRLEKDYLLIPSMEGRRHAMAILKWMRAKYSNSPEFARAERQADTAFGIPPPKADSTTPP
ncbi:MAG TPA: hypothetical protein VMV73_03630 [Candidatus Dormibacteraeota bacterium]|nr:hypothetical protein [Candidatus Dormibacteraeota bacterium]